MPAQLSRSNVARRQAKSGAIATFLGAINFFISQDPLSRTYSLATTTIGLALYLEQRRALREEISSGRYGPREPYDIERGFGHIEYLLTRPSERLFKGWFRINRTSFTRLVEIIKDDRAFVSTGNRPQAPVKYQLAAYLSKYGQATGTKVALTLLISEGTVYNFCRRVVRALRRLKKAFLMWPTSERKREIKIRAQEDGFPGAIGSVDGTYIPLEKKPVKHGISYWCRKKRYALNMQAIVDFDGYILSYDLGWPGSVPDVSVWKRSHVWENRDSYFEGDEWVLGDKGYSLTKYLITPYEIHEFGDDPDTASKQKKWNKAFSRQRIGVEHAFGRLKIRFGYLHEVPGSDLHNTLRVVESLLVLHNILQSFGDIPDDIPGANIPAVIRGLRENRFRENNGRENEFQPSEDNARVGNHNRMLGKERRRQLVDYWFENVCHV